MKYQYKIVQNYPDKLFYTFDSDVPYTFNIGDRVWFPEDWKKELGGQHTWVVKHVEHYLVDKLIVIKVVEED